MSLYSSTNSDFNVAVGDNCLLAQTTGNQNVVVGASALAALTSGDANSAFGGWALSGLSTGSSNVAVGYQSGQSIGTGAKNSQAQQSVFLGSLSKAAGLNQTNQVVIGYNALGRGSNTVQIGNASMTSIGGQVAWSNTSDVRLKKGITTSQYGLNFINKLRPVTYFLKSGPTDLQTGFIAQEVEAAANEINYKFSGIVKPEKAEDFYSLRYSEFVVPLVKAVQEQQQQIEAKEARIQEMENRLQKLEALVQTLTNEKK